MTNTEIMSDLCNDSNGSDSESEGEHKYYYINKDLFYFYISLYGGGPAIVHIKDFERYEL